MTYLKWLLAVFGLSTVLATGMVASADADYDQALKTAPQGISLDNIFVPGKTSNNQAAIVNTTNPNITGTQAAKVNNGKKQFGALWSTTDNHFDLTKNMKSSMWMYFGNTGKKAADGMALVFQNDARGLAATPTYGKTVSGETLGVWGVDTDKKQTTPDKLASTAIQNSWALEFDTHLNTSTNYGNTGGADSFDVGISGPHIASNYPGEVSTYEMVRTSTLLPIYSVGYYATQTHAGTITGDYTMLSNGAWHHLTIDWQASTKQMTYTFDDKDPNTGKKQTGKSASVTLDTTKIDPNNTGQVRWGFTGATGDSYENNLVIFEEIPGLVEVDANATLTDMTQNKVVDNDGTVKGGDKVRLDYQLSYEGGKQEWKDVVAQLKLPSKLSFTKGTITYADGTSTAVDLSGLDSERQLTVKLAKALSSSNQTATISFMGTADGVTEPASVTGLTSTFTAVNGVETASTVDFTLNPTQEVLLASLNGTTFSADDGDVTVKGSVVVPDSTNLKNTDITVKSTLNGRAQADFKIPESDDNESGRFDYTVKPNQLTAGDNTLIITVADPYGNESNPLKVTITLTGQVLFNGVAEASSFQSTTLTGSQQQVKRGNDWQVNVLDTRTAGATWTLQVSATAFTTKDGRQLAGGLYFHDDTGKTAVTTTPMNIASGQSTSNDDEKDIVSDWQDETGLLLDVGSASVSGQYQSQLTWTLNDTP